MWDQIANFTTRIALSHGVGGNIAASTHATVTIVAIFIFVSLHDIPRLIQYIESYACLAGEHIF